MARRIAFFDFDGTITTKDTLLEIIKFQKGAPLLYTGFLLNSPWLLAFKAGIIPNYTAKQRILRFFFRNTPLPAFQSRCDEFAATVLPTLLRPKALEEIRRHQDAGTEVVVVSASAGNWISHWTTSLHLPLIATRLQTTSQTATASNDHTPASPPLTAQNDPAPILSHPAALSQSQPDATQLRLTGRIEGRNCYGPEKVARIREAYDLSQYDEIYAYGDSGGDREMLALANRPFYKPFR